MKAPFKSENRPSRGSDDAMDGAWRTRGVGARNLFRFNIRSSGGSELLENAAESEHRSGLKSTLLCRSAFCSDSDFRPSRSAFRCGFLIELLAVIPHCDSISESVSMKLYINRNLLLLPLLVGCFSLMTAGPLTAQPLMTLHSFKGSDGDEPSGGFILSGNTLYGTARWGGESGSGTVFSLDTDGSGFTNLHSFATGGWPSGNRSDGIGPAATRTRKRREMLR